MSNLLKLFSKPKRKGDEKYVSQLILPNPNENYLKKIF